MIFDFKRFHMLIQFKPFHMLIQFVVSELFGGRSAIREMVVRGAPAIAIAAALSLAVEVSSLMDFTGTPDEAASFLIGKLEYLVSSRPTAVNLSDAATKLTDIVRNAVATASEANTVFQASQSFMSLLAELDFLASFTVVIGIVYTEAAEIMLKDDVASNKAIGAYGATFLHNQLKDSEKMCILTHCNTGSLATAGYGTALGVIRAIHSEGVLERAYCTETRPFNQVSQIDFVLKHKYSESSLTFYFPSFHFVNTIRFCIEFSTNKIFDISIKFLLGSTVSHLANMRQYGGIV
ncbi:hypothetical protein Leryth_002341 [Lithospermum erythrorhizon]|nr:hypothetical protein Leryth_002341 [Lithospermum erythrorhizon]